MCTWTQAVSESRLGWLALVASFATACDDDSTSADAGAESPSEVTYWKDMVPLFEQHCLQCHHEGGIGHVRLDLYAEAKELAALVGYETMARQMPPWDATSDGSCGDFRGSLALDDAQIALIADCVAGGAKEGKAGRVNVPAPDRLQNASDYALPNYAPVVQGGMLAENDDCHCFLLDANLAAERFITGYDIVPGTPEIVHHVLVMVVDPDAPANLIEAPADLRLPAGTTNGQMMAALDAESPDKPGWPCGAKHGMACSFDRPKRGWSSPSIYATRRSSPLPLGSSLPTIASRSRNVVFLSRRSRGRGAFEETICTHLRALLLGDLKRAFSRSGRCRMWQACTEALQLGSRVEQIGFLLLKNES